MNEQVYTVSEAAQKIQTIIEQFIGPLWIEGEVSNYSRSRAGHIYFSIKDQQSLIKCVIWRNRADSIPFRISGGMRVIVFGNATTYKSQSQYQLNVSKIKAAGLGNLYLAFESLKKKLSNEGLFNDDRKKDIPKYPKNVGVITSATGAAVRDILQISARRNPSVKMIVFPAQVQGEKAADTIIEGIRIFNSLKNVDLIIAGRGGGSIEDLWAFNEEKVVRAIVDSELPVISAVGHEVDFTLSDFAADLRAPTPSAAAEICIPDFTEIKTGLTQFNYSIHQNLQWKIDRIKSQLFSLRKTLEFLNPEEIIKQKWQKLDDLEMKITNIVRQQLKNQKIKIDSIRSQLFALNPRLVLKRGYALIYQGTGEKVIKSISQIKLKDTISVELNDGTFGAEVKKISPKK